MHFLLVLIAFIAQVGQGGGADENVTEAPVAGAPVAEAAEVVAVAEPQVPTGKFTTATEVRPILDATKANWVAVREFNGQDLVYFTHLLAWRCGLVQLSYAINGGPVTEFPMPPCHADEPAPNALKTEDGLPYVIHVLDSVQRIDVHVVYDDLQRDTLSVERQGVLMP